MFPNNRCIKPAMISLLSVAMLLAFTNLAGAHCDRVNGPVATAARTALDKGDFDAVAIWVGEEQERELRQRFQQCQNVYREGGKGKQLAVRYFMETAVRLHREAEGMPYTGLKPASPLPPDIAAAEKALDTGDLKPVILLLTKAMRQQTGKLFRKAMDAQEEKSDSLEKGREWADAYVKYVIFVHGLYQAILAGPEHGVGD